MQAVSPVSSEYATVPSQAVQLWCKSGAEAASSFMVPAGHEVHDVWRCPDVFWNLPPSHVLQVRAAVVESSDIFSPIPHVVCAVHNALPTPLHVSEAHTAQPCT